MNNIYRADALRSHSITWETQLHSFQDSDFNIQALLRGLKYDYAPTAPDYGDYAPDPTMPVYGPQGN